MKHLIHLTVRGKGISKHLKVTDLKLPSVLVLRSMVSTDLVISGLHLFQQPTHSHHHHTPILCATGGIQESHASGQKTCTERPALHSTTNSDTNLLHKNQLHQPNLVIASNPISSLLSNRLSTFLAGAPRFAWKYYNKKQLPSGIQRSAKVSTPKHCQTSMPNDYNFIHQAVRLACDWRLACLNLGSSEHQRAEHLGIHVQPSGQYSITQSIQGTKHPMLWNLPCPTGYLGKTAVGWLGCQTILQG